MHFGKKLTWELFGKPLPNPMPLILNPFGGKSESGLRCDLKADAEPDFFADAHRLPFKDNSFDAVYLDPPYNNELSKELYGTGNIKYKVFSMEAVRVC